MEFLTKFLKGVSLPPLSISFEDRKVVFVRKEGKAVKSYFVEELEEEVGKLKEGEWTINLSERSVLTISQRITKNLKKLDRAVILIPDFLTNVFVISFEHLPQKRSEIESVVRWRMEKQFPLKEDSVLRFHLFKKNKETKALVVSVSKPIIHQFISLMESIGIKTPFISIPVITMQNFIRNISSAKNGWIIVNRLPEGTSFFGFSISSAIIFRGKIGWLSKSEVVDEAISTMKWMEEKEGVKVDEIWIRDLSHERWDDLGKPFLTLSSLENKFRDIEILAPHLGIPEWVE